MSAPQNEEEQFDIVEPGDNEIEDFETSRRKDRAREARYSRDSAYDSPGQGQSPTDTRWDNHANGGPSQPQADLGEWTNAVEETAKHVSNAENSFRNLGSSFRQHAADVKSINETKQRAIELEEACKGKDRKITRLKAAIEALTEHKQENEAKLKLRNDALQQREEELERQRRQFEGDREEAFKRIKAQEIEQRIKQEDEFQKLKTEQLDKFQQQKKRLEEETDRRIAEVESEREKFLTELEAERRSSEEAKNDLDKMRKENNDLRILRDKYEKRANKLQTKFEKVGKELGLETKGKEFYTKGFHDLSTQIEDIAMQFFADPDLKISDEDRQTLILSDSSFKYVPISASKESRDLRIAHAQRVISHFLSAAVFYPFSSDRTSKNPIIAESLQHVAQLLLTSYSEATSGMRGKVIWSSLTMRALLNTQGRPAPDSLSSFTTRHLTRSERLESGVMSVLKPLLDHDRSDEFKTKLRQLAEHATSLWDYAQLDELDFQLCSTLDNADRHEWRSKLDDSDATDADSSVQAQQIYTLFPRITAHQLLPKESSTVSPPDSWLVSDGIFERKEFCIHPGIDLLESSSIAKKGKAEELRRLEEVAERKYQEGMKKLELERNLVIGKNRSTGDGLMTMLGRTGASESPSSLWMSDGRRGVILD